MTNIEFNDLSTNLRKRRMELGLTQREVAERANMPIATYARYEYALNKCEPRYTKMVYIANALNTSVDKLIGLQTTKKQRQENQLLSSLYTSSFSDKMYFIYKNKQYAVSQQDVADIIQNIEQLINQSTVLADKLDNLQLDISEVKTNKTKDTAESIKKSILSTLIQKLATA